MFTVAEFKEIEPRLKYGWFHLKLYSMFQLKPVLGGFYTLLKFIKFGLSAHRTIFKFKS